MDNLKNVKNTHGRVLLLVKLQAESCNFTAKSNTPPWVFFTFLKLNKWYQIAQRTTSVALISPYTATIPRWFANGLHYSYSCIYIQEIYIYGWKFTTQTENRHPNGSWPSSILANFFLYTYENEYMSELISSDKVKARHFHATNVLLMILVP